MPRFNKFEEIDVWQKARGHCQKIYQTTARSNFGKDRSLSEQIQKAVVSISSNIAEGFERNSRKEFIRFLLFAKGSAGEVRSQLYLARDLGYLSTEEFEELYEENLEICKMISGLITYLRE